MKTLERGPAVHLVGDPERHNRQQIIIEKDVDIVFPLFDDDQSEFHRSGNQVEARWEFD